MQFALAVLCAVFLANDWSRFRGPNGTGIDDSVSFPSSWTDSDIAWKTKLPGTGNSCPVSWGDRVFLLSADPSSATRHVLAIDRQTGNIVWTRDFPGAPHPLHDRNTFASSTPAVDEQAVYVAWADPTATTLKAFTHEGRELWSRDLGPMVSQHGFGASPILYAGKLFLFNEQQADDLKEGQTPGISRMMAFDLADGRTLWETPLKTTRVCYSVPCIRRNAEGKDELVTCNTGNGIFALDPDTGKINWQISVFDQRTVASPVLIDDLVIGSCGSGAGANQLVAVRPGPNPEEVYRIRTNANYVPTPIIVGDLAFLFYDKGVASCIDARTGEVFWKERLKGEFSASPVCASGKIYAVNDQGLVQVIAAKKEFEILGEADLGHPTRSTPGIAGDLLLFRTQSELIAIRGE